MRWATFTLDLKLLHLLDNVIDWPRPSRIPLVVSPWDSPVGHVAGDGFLCSLKGGRPATLWSMVGWWMDVVVRIIVGHESKEALDVRRRHVKKLLASED